jgi:hypothetical protein
MKAKRRSTPGTALDIIATVVRTSKNEPLTSRAVIEHVLRRLTPEQCQELYNDSCYYYESREGPYDYLVDKAIELGVIEWDERAWGYRLGRNGQRYGVYVQRKM